MSASRPTSRAISSYVSSASRSSHGSPSAGMQYWQRKLQRSVTEMRTSPIARLWPSISCSRNLRSEDRGGAEGMPASGSMEVTLPARLVQQLDALDDHAGLDPLDHVVDRQRADAAGDHRLHLHPGAGAGARLGDQRHGAVLGVNGH